MIYLPDNTATIQKLRSLTQTTPNMTGFTLNDRMPLGSNVWQWQHASEANCEFLDFSTGHVRFTVANGDHVLTDDAAQNKVRGEFNRVPGFGVRDTIWFSLLVKIPSDANESYWLTSDTDGWCIFTQIHQSAQSETSHGQPPVTLRLNPVSGNLIVRNTTSDPEDSTVPVKTDLTTTAISKNVPHHFVGAVTMDRGETSGSISIWLDGTQITDFSGAVGLPNDDGCAFKWGIYRGETTPDVSTVFEFAHVQCQPYSLAHLIGNPPAWPG